MYGWGVGEMQVEEQACTRVLNIFLHPFPFPPCTCASTIAGAGLRRPIEDPLNSWTGVAAAQK